MSTAHIHLVLNELDAMLTHTLERTTIPGQAEPVTRYAKATWRLTNDAAPGFAATTPGNGNPGGGHGASITTPGRNYRTGDTRVVTRPDGTHVDVTERWLEVGLIDDTEDRADDAYTSTERLALTASPLDRAAAGELHTLATAPRAIYVHTAALHIALGAPLPDHHPTSSTLLLDHALTTIRHITDTPTMIDNDACTLGRCNTIARRVTDLYTVVKRWGYDPSRPIVTDAERELLAHDPTETMCVSCLRAGRRDYRYRGDLCQWCYRFQRLEGFLPPFDLLEVRARYGTVTDTLIEPHRQRHRDRQANARKSA